MAARFGLTAGDVDAEVAADVAAVGEAVVLVLPWAVVPAAAAAGWLFRCGVSCPIIRRAAWSGLKVGADELALLELVLVLLLLLAFLLLSFLAEDVK